MTWLHGGKEGLCVGDWLLPSRTTGATRLPMSHKKRVYVTTVLRHALVYACAFPYPAVYEVEPEGAVGRDPDLNYPPGENGTCARARIVRVLEVDPCLIAAARITMALMYHVPWERA